MTTTTIHAASDGVPDPRAAAAELARRWRVFPVRPGDKRPAVLDWEHRACSDPERVAQFWPSRRHNIGIACGPSRLVVLDLDAHGTLPEEWRLPGLVDGKDVLAQFCEWAGQPLPYTYTVATPGNGWHLYFSAPAGQEIRNSASLIGPMIDVRGAGGYVVAAGSVVNGRRYEVVNGSEPIALPRWLVRLLSRRTEHAAAAGLSPGAPAPRLRGLVAHVRGGVEHDRNGRLHWASCRAAEMIATGQLARTEAEEALVAAALDAGLRGGEREARRTFASAMRSTG